MSKPPNERNADLDQAALRAAARLSSRAVERLGVLLESQDGRVALDAAKEILRLSTPPEPWQWLEPDDETKPGAAGE